MRFFHVLPVLSVLLGTSASTLDSRAPVAHPLDARDVLDVCASIDQLVEFFFPITHAPALIDPVDSCLCLSTLTAFAETDPIARAAVAITGGQTATVINALTPLILAKAPTNCNYPENSSPACVNGSPCGFDCLNGYTASPSSSPTTCACAAPNVVCNGNCVAAGACPSSQVTTLKRRWVGSGSCTEMGLGWAACGVFGGGARAWECVNTARDLESCGGCVLPLTPLSPIGEDCTALPGVADVSCLSGECVVRRCMPGYVLSRDRTHCVSTQTHTSQPHVSVPEDDDEYMQAIRYGLEHLPL